MNWDDLRIFLTIAKSGGLKKAARKLSIHHTSCARRLKSLEDDLGSKLFDRLPTGYVLTTTGRQLALSADVILSEISNIERDLIGKDTRLEGPIKLSMPNGFATHFLMPSITEFMNRYPDVQITISMTYAFSDLANREADIAIRHIDDPPQTLAGRKIARLYRSAYASIDYLACHDPVREPEKCHWLGWGPPEDHLKWPQKRKFENVPVRGDMYSDVAQLSAAQAHMGIASLPCFIGDVAENLVRVPTAVAEPTDWIWILAHRDMISNARVCALMDHIEGFFKAHTNLLEGVVNMEQDDQQSNDHV